MSSDLNEQLATLAREQGRLEALLGADTSWRALQQLEAREARGEPLSSIDGPGLKARLLADLAANRLFQARTKILEAIGILTESAALPSPDSLVPAAVAAVVEAVPAPVVQDALPLAAAPEPAAARETAAAEVQHAPRAIIHDTPFVEPSHPDTAAPGALELTAIRGIDVGLARRLSSLGFTQYCDIAMWTPEEVQRVSAELGLGRDVSRQNWIEQAAVLALKAGQSIAKPVVHRAVAAAAAPPPGPEVAAVVAPAIAPPVDSIVSEIAQSIAARISQTLADAAGQPPQSAVAEVVASVATVAALSPEAQPQPEPAELEVPEATVEIVAAPQSSNFQERFADAIAALEDGDTGAQEHGGRLNGTTVHVADRALDAPATLQLDDDWAPSPDSIAAESDRLPDVLEKRLSELELDVAAATSETAKSIVAPVLPPAPPPVATIETPILPDVGTATIDMLPPVPARMPERRSGEAEVEVVQRAAASGQGESGYAGATRSPDFDASEYAAYREQAEEASVEIVREGDRPQRTRLPGKPTRATREEQASAVRRFLAALNGK